MPGPKMVSPPEAARLSGIYRFISPENFAELGIDPEDVPLGTFPAEDHPPFLLHRFGGNAYGLGLFEQSLLPMEEVKILEGLDLEDPKQVVVRYRELNNIFKRLGLLIRYTKNGRPFYLIPRQFVAQYLVEVQGRLDEITTFLNDLMSRRLRESLKVGILAEKNEIIFNELQNRMPDLEFQRLDSLEVLAQKEATFDALVVMDDFRDFAMRLAAGKGIKPPRDRQGREAYGYFATSLIYDLLREEGEILCVAERPLGASREILTVNFADQGEFKRFLLFSHVFRTRRRYKSAEGMRLKINRFDFNAFLSGRGPYQGTVQGLLNGRSMAYIDPAEIDGLPYQDLPLPRGSAPQLLTAWKRWFEPFFVVSRLTSVLPDAVRADWESKYHLEGEFPLTLLVLHGERYRPPISLTNITSQLEHQRLAGCSVELLAGYKNSFTYVHKVLYILKQVKENTLRDIPGLELTRMRKALETSEPHSQLNDILKLMDLAPTLDRLEQRLNPDRLLGPRTPVLENLEKLSLMGIKEGPLKQLCLMVLGHSTLSRVTFGKLPETTLHRLTDIRHYSSLEEAISVLRLYRLLSVAESAAASPEGLNPEQLKELFKISDYGIRVVSEPDLTWEDLLDAQVSRMGGVQAMATRKMLKLFNLFDFLDNWQDLVEAGPRQKEALADFDGQKLARIQKVTELIRQVRLFVERFYMGDSAARPFFFRALLNCELHGSGRLLPRLGPAAGFALLWICIHCSERKLLDFNTLLDVKDPDDLAKRLDRLYQDLIQLTPQRLSPKMLAGLKDALIQKGEAYLYDSGLYLRLNPRTGALTPALVDAQEELTHLKDELELSLGRPLAQIPPARLKSMDHRSFEVGRFLAALDSKNKTSPDEPDPFDRFSSMHAKLTRQMEEYLLDQLFDLPLFASNLNLLMQNCPHLMNRLLPQTSPEPHNSHRMVAAAKLSALFQRRHDGFQNMVLSHEAARQEFGPTASGIVGISVLQFHELASNLKSIIKAQPRLGLLLMLSVLLVNPQDEPQGPDDFAASSLGPRMGFTNQMEKELLFLLEHSGRLWQVISGQACLMGLADLLNLKDPLLMEALFILSVIRTAACSEGFLTEDLLGQFMALLQKIRGLTRRQASASTAFGRHIEDHARQYLAFEHYREIQDGEAPTASLRYLLETMPIPDERREYLLDMGRRSVGLERLLKLRDLYLVNSLDLLMLNHDVPVVYIYRLKGLRSMGPTHFERELYEARRLYRGLNRLEKKLQDFILTSLADAEKPVRLVGFSPAAERLTYANQIRLLFLGLAAAHWLKLEASGPLTISFLPMARVIERKFELVNQTITALKPSGLYENPRRLARFLEARQGLAMHFDSGSNTLKIQIIDPVQFDRKIEAIRRAKSPEGLKQLYHNELRKLKSTTYSTLDYQQRLEAAFNDNLDRLGKAMLKRVRRRMAEADTLDLLSDIFEAAWEEGLELPLAKDRQHNLRDLFEVNVERLRAGFLEDMDQHLAVLKSQAALDELWRSLKQRLKSQRRFWGKDFDLLLARRFDRRAAELEEW